MSIFFCILFRVLLDLDLPVLDLDLFSLVLLPDLDRVLLLRLVRDLGLLVLLREAVGDLLWRLVLDLDLLLASAVLLRLGVLVCDPVRGGLATLGMLGDLAICLATAAADNRPGSWAPLGVLVLLLTLPLFVLDLDLLLLLSPRGERILSPRARCLPLSPLA